LHLGSDVTGADADLHVDSPSLPLTFFSGANECTISTLILKLLIDIGNSANQEFIARFLSWGKLANIIER
jgi:hypothetical protein